MRDERRAQILEVALDLFATKGLVATKITDIAEKSGIAQGLLYHYFQSKEAIYIELIRKAFDGMVEATRELERMALPPRAKIEKALTDLLAMLESKEGFATYFLLTTQASVSAAVPEEALSIIRKRRSVPYDGIARILRAGQSEGTIRNVDADELAVVFWTTIKGLAMQRASFGKKYRSPSPRTLFPLFFTESKS